MEKVIIIFNYNISNFYRTFTGTDSMAFVVFPNCKPICIGNITTITYSIFRNKKTVFVLGKVMQSGIAKGNRIVAGTIIMTVINQNWVNDLKDQIPALKEFDNLKSDDLPPFDIMVVCANEYGAAIDYQIYGASVTDEGQVVSVEDMFSENTFSFIARDIVVPKKIDTGVKLADRITINPMLKQTPVDIKIKEFIEHKKDLILSIPFIKGNEVNEVQKLLNNNDIETKIDGVYGLDTYNKVMKFQSLNNLPPTGNVDKKTYNYLSKCFKANNDIISGKIINKNGAYVHCKPNFSSKINDKLCYNKNINMFKINNDWYKTKNGYIHSNNIYSAYNEKQKDFQTIHPNDKNKIIKHIQTKLNKILKTSLAITGIYNYETQCAILAYESTKNLPINRNITYNVYNTLKQEN